MITDSNIAYLYLSSMAFTASLNGQVIAWDTQSLARKHTIGLPDTDKLVSIKYYKDNIWCCKY